MTVLVTGSAGHLGEALVRTLRNAGRDVRGIDIKASAWTDQIGSITDRNFVEVAMEGVNALIHTATLHKPHVATHSYDDFIQTNIAGTQNLLAAALANQVRAFVFTSTTSTFGGALSPAPDQPAAWIDETVVSVPKNIYGTTKVAAEGICELFHRRHKLPVIVLRTSRFFPEEDDDPETRGLYSMDNAKANELLYRRADIADIVSAHLLALENAGAIGFGRYIISATTPFGRGDLGDLRGRGRDVVERLFPGSGTLYAQNGWTQFADFDRVYDNGAARAALGWVPKYDFAHVLARLREGRDFASPLTRAIGSKGYHDEVFADRPYPVAR
jgi:UDP-glucose 4-epimerase